ncbi:MAG: hypothetical protein KAS64_11875, partial [Spirochaetes bacterium]|nr:hypothetical protein [Spirochaetota bacterium]
GQSDFTLYFTSDRSGINRLYTADMFLDGVFSTPDIQNIAQSGTNVPIRYFAVLPQNVSTNLQSDVVFYTTKDLQVRRNHVGLNEMNLYVGMGAGALSGLVIGVLPPNAVYPSFKIASNRFGLVVAQTNLPGIYELNVYEFDINMIDSAGIDALALKKRSFPQNAVQAGGGSWIPTTALDLPIDAFLYSADGLNGHDIYVTDFTSFNIRLGLISSLGQDASPYYSIGDKRLYFTSTGFRLGDKFNLFRWRSNSWILAIRDFIKNIYADNNFDKVRPIVNVIAPTDNTDISGGLGISVTANALDENGIKSIYISAFYHVSNTHIVTVYSNQNSINYYFDFSTYSIPDSV